VEEKLA
jgi:hypothetical protein